MKKILLQFDSDPLPSSFDAITALDGGADVLLQYGHVTEANVVPLVHGAIFTRSPQDLSQTAIFIGGSNVDEAELILKKVQESFFGPMRVSVMMDANGCNTTAAAAVIAAEKHVPLADSRAVVLGGTGPVGRRAAQILVKQGCQVTLVSRTIEKAKRVCQQIDGDLLNLIPAAMPESGNVLELLKETNLLISAGAAGVEFCSIDKLVDLPQMRVVIDLNAVPPLGISGVDSSDQAQECGQIICYGALGVGGFKMKLHRYLISALFESSQQVFNTETIYETGGSLG